MDESGLPSLFFGSLPPVAPNTVLDRGRLPHRPTLRPGLRVFRRDDTHLQIGLDDPQVVLPDRPGVHDLVRDLQRADGLGSLSPEAGLALGRLLDAGLVVDQADVDAARLDRSGSASAALTAHGPEAPARLTSRAACHVVLHAPEPWLTVAADRLVTAGIPRAHSNDAPDVALLVSVGEPPRSQVDRYVRDDLPHLVLALFADRARLGPLVVPGATACLRCVDAHLVEVDPRRPVVLEQLEDHTPPPPCDPLLAQAALALAVRELVSYAEGDRPATWSASLTLGADLGQPLRSWLRHPHCGCSWG